MGREPDSAYKDPLLQMGSEHCLPARLQSLKTADADSNFSSCVVDTLSSAYCASDKTESVQLPATSVLPSMSSGVGQRVSKLPWINKRLIEEPASTKSTTTSTTRPATIKATRCFRGCEWFPDCDSAQSIPFPVTA